MAIEHKLLIQGKLIEIEQLMDYCTEKIINFEWLNDSCLFLTDLNISIYLLINQETQNDVWKSYIFNMDFVYNGTILFNLGNDIELWEEQITFIINFVFDIMLKSKQEGLFVYNLDTEICYFKCDGSRQIVDDFGVIEKYYK